MNEEELMEKLKPFLNKSYKSMMEISSGTSEDMQILFSYIFAQRALCAFIITTMDGVSITKDLHELIQELVNTSIEKSIQMKIITTQE